MADRSTKRAHTKAFGAALGEKVGGGDTVPTDHWLGGREPAQVVFDCVADLGTQRDEFLEAFERDWDLLLVVHCDHPYLADIVEWATNEPPEAGEVLLLASPSGPAPPAVFCLERPPWGHGPPPG